MSQFPPSAIGAPWHSSYFPQALGPQGAPMSASRLAAGFAALALSGLGIFGLQSPAYANHRCPNPGGNYPPGQCATEGHGDNAGGNGGEVKTGEKIKCE